MLSINREIGLWGSDGRIFVCLPMDDTHGFLDIAAKTIRGWVGLAPGGIAPRVESGTACTWLVMRGRPDRLVTCLHVVVGNGKGESALQRLHERGKLAVGNAFLNMQGKWAISVKSKHGVPAPLACDEVLVCAYPKMEEFQAISVCVDHRHDVCVMRPGRPIMNLGLPALAEGLKDHLVQAVFGSDEIMCHVPPATRDTILELTREARALLSDGIR